MRAMALKWLASCCGALLVVAAGATAAAPQTAEPSLRFADVTTAAGVSHKSTLTWGTTWVDHDDDGDPDLFANRHWYAPRFFENLGGHYTLTPEEFPHPSGKIFDRHSCAWGEANGDGRVDFYCDSGAQSGMGSGPNQLWIQTRRGFVDHSARYGTRELFGRSRSVNWIDYDTDGDLDIFIGNKLRNGFPNVMFRNDRGRFRKADVGLSEEMNTLSSTWSDWDRDGDPDLLLTRYAPETAVAYENVGARFQQVGLPGITGERWNSATWGDYDGDGWSDLHLVGEHVSIIMKNLRGRFIEVHETELQAGRASAWLDVDNDADLDAFIVQGKQGATNKPDIFLIRSLTGFSVVSGESFAGPSDGSGESVAASDHDLDGDLDLLTTNGATLVDDSEEVEGRWILLENRSEVGNWVALDLEGPAWNPWGFGSRIFVQTTAPLLGYWREVTDGVALRTQYQAGDLLFGIGSSDQVILRVEWPGGIVDCLAAEAGATKTLRIGSSPCT